MCGVVWLMIAWSDRTLPAAETRPLYSQPNMSTCADSVFTFQANFWVNLHLFLRAEARRRRLNAPQEMSAAALTPEEISAWRASLDAYDGIAQLNPLFDEQLISFVNRLAQSSEASALPPMQGDHSIVDALNRAAPVYRTHRWPDDRKQDVAWIAANCADVQQRDGEERRVIADYFHIKPPSQPILVDLARETGPTLAYTTAGPHGYSGHTILAPQKNAGRIEAVNTIYHEISHTMVDAPLIDAINEKAAQEHLRAPEDLWHAVTLYSTEEITKRIINANSTLVTSLDADRAQMFERNRWRSFLLALEKDWQPYLDKKVEFDVALTNLVRDTSK
jgi:hypothetical protein